MSLNLTILTASTRPGRVGPTVAAWVEQFARDNSSFDISAVDLADVGLPLLDEPAHPGKQDYQHEHTKRWSALIEPADAFIFVTPEYDYFPPAGLINALQCLSNEWQKKPASIVSYGGVSGGLRATQVLRSLLGSFNMVAVTQTVPVPFVSKHIKDGTFEPNDEMKQGARLMLSALEDWAKVLAPMRRAG